ncbi:PTS lactose transporter subunit IIC [Meridianimarinicoccus roseus]|jgi:PTS system nitrogen regulatory IIA component|uniref:PTS lactose transporter subunit IIC n=1 Tax=Meridianimarinicoccus roseus TaxID=2072018 RepID=A0A2V2LG29_9RHOB|nr:PTS sugar transporter subunit IIA [Meridianimarinicoccus roseus]PWR02861.1 PTS lactose transporter subunit IIC [Meridianimarinicoccus roseus]
MTLGSLLKPEAVKVLGNVTSKKRLMRDLCDIAAGCYGIDTEEALSALQDRESIGPTGVGGGVALPHARIPSLEKVVGVFVRLERPVPFEAVDRQPVDLVFALFAPEDSGVHHLKALALVSRALRGAKVQAKLRANEDPVILHTILVGAEESQAA